MYPAAESVQESFKADGVDLSDLDSKFIELVLWYDGFNDVDKMRSLKYDKDDLLILVAKMNEARSEKDYKTSDAIRDALRRAGREDLGKNK